MSPCTPTHCIHRRFGNNAPADPLETLIHARDYIRALGSIKPGWTEGQHDAYWMLQKRIEEFYSERNVHFFPMATGPHMERIL